MDHYFDINSWKRLLDQLEPSDAKVSKETLIELSNFFQHLPSQVAPRFRKEYETSVLRSNKLLGELFDKIDLSDKPLLCILLRLLRSFGYARISQITYHVGQYELAQIEQVPIYYPQIERSKWYDMQPLLPQAGTISWDNIMNHGLVHEEPELFNVCLQLLCQKLQFYTIIINLSQFQDSFDRIKKNATKVVQKLIELIKDATCDDQTTVGFDSFLFQLLLPFSNQEQRDAMVDAIVQDLFKPYVTQQPLSDEQNNKMFDLINCCVLNQIQLQNLLISKILEHLKCNIISRKRRHSVEALEDSLTLENLLDDVREDNYNNLLTRATDIKVSSKKFRANYLSYWLKTINNILIQRTLKDHNSLRLLCSCSTLLITASNLMDESLVEQLTDLMAKIVDFTGPFRHERLFKVYDPTFLIGLSKILIEKTTIIIGFQPPIQKFYKLYLNRYLRHTMIKSDKTECEKMNKFVEFACDRNIGKDASHLLQYVCLHELASCLEGKVSNKVTEIYLESARNCGLKLFKFIKRNLAIKDRSSISENGFSDYDVASDCNNSIDINDSEQKEAVVVDTLVCILRIAMVRKDQQLLDSYGDVLVKLFDFIISRVEVLIKVSNTGKSGNSHPLDAYLPKLLTLYTENSEMIKGYLTYELISKLTDLLLTGESGSSKVFTNGNCKNDKKQVYNQLKSKLEALEDRAVKSVDVYPLIINKQYGLVIDQSIGNGEIKKEKSCCKSYLNEMKTLHEVYSIVLTSCDLEIYEKVLNRIVESIEQVDHLDHPRVLYLLLMLETLIPKYKYKEFKNPGDHFDLFKRKMAIISTSLIRIAKSVELGPSIHVFTNSGTHKTSKAAQCCTYANCIKIYTQIFNRYPSNWSNALITDAMQMCVSSNLVQYARYTQRMQRYFIQLASAITGLLKSMFMYKKEEEVLKSSMPIFLSVFLDLIRCLILASDKQKLEAQSRKRQSNGHNSESMDVDDDNIHEDLTLRDSEFEKQLELLSMDMSRILNSLSSLKVKLLDYAPHLISTYVKDIQRASCPDFVKLHLNEGIFRIFNLVDAHQRERLEEIVEAGVQRKTTAARASGSLFEMIHARLDQASREIFKSMHDDYNRFHRYQGKC